MQRLPTGGQSDAQGLAILGNAGVAAILGPIVGPTLGGWICVHYDWRWIFLINIPMGVFALVACYVLLEDPDYLKRERAELRSRPLNFDYIGLGLLALRDGRWKLIHELESGRSRLYDLEADPEERRDAAALHPARAEAYREHLLGWAAAQKYRITKAP